MGLLVPVIFCSLDVACVAGVVGEGRWRGSEKKGGVTQAMSMVASLADLFCFATSQKSVCEGGYLNGGGDQSFSQCSLSGKNFLDAKGFCYVALKMMHNNFKFVCLECLKTTFLSTSDIQI